MKPQSTYSALAARIRAAGDRAALARCEAQYTRHYNAGTITASELSRLDTLAMGRGAEIPAPITLIGDPGHKEAQAALVRNLTTRPAWKLADCAFNP